MTTALEGAWETAPPHSKIRTQLAEAVAKVAKLRQGIYKKILQKNSPQRAPWAGLETKS